MLKYILIITTAILTLPMLSLLKLAFNVYREYQLVIFKIKIMVAMLSIFYLVISLVANLMLNYFISLLLFNISIVIITISGLSLYIYFHALITEKMRLYVIFICFILVIIKVFSLINNPVRLYIIDDIFIREAHLDTLGVFVATMVIILIMLSLVRLHYHVRKKFHYQRYSRFIAGVYSIIIIMIPLFMIGHKVLIISILIPYIEGILNSFVIFYLVLYFRNDPEKLVLLPVYARGIIIYTYRGLPIIQRIIDKKGERLVILASTIIESLLSLELTMMRLRKSREIKTYDLVDSKILIYFSAKLIGAIIINRDNPVVRNILRAIIHELESYLNYIDESIITERELDLVNLVINKYVTFLI